MLREGSLEHHGEYGGTERTAELLRRSGDDAGVRYLGPVESEICAGHDGNRHSTEPDAAHHQRCNQPPFGGTRGGEGKRQCGSADDHHTGESYPTCADPVRQPAGCRKLPITPTWARPNVAARAGTSRPVIYRRWPTRSDLAIAAIRHPGQIQPFATPNTGSVRGDLIPLLRDASASRSDVAVLISVQMGEYFAETGWAPGDPRAEFLSGRQRFGIDEVLGRGVERGEIDPGRLTPRIATVAPDLLRHEMLMTLQPVSEAAIGEIVDDIFLPLVRPAGEARSGTVP